MEDGLFHNGELVKYFKLLRSVALLLLLEYFILFNLLTSLDKR